MSHFFSGKFIVALIIDFLFSKNHLFFQLNIDRFCAQGVKETTLIEENLYQDSNAFVLLSTQKGDSGKILFCNKSLMELCGGNSSKGYLGSHISSIFSPSLRGHYDNLFKQTIRAGDQRLVNKHHRAYLFHKNKYIIEADFCLKYHPYLTQNLCFDMIIRPVPTNREYILMKEDGEIEGGSCEIAKFLKLSDINSNARTSVYAKNLSDDLVNPYRGGFFRS